MAVIDITIKERIATVNSGVVLVCNNPTDTIRFTFDDEWADHEVKTARFAWEGKYVDVPFEGNEVQTPEIYRTNYVYIGVYTDNLTSTHAKVPCRFSIKCLDGKNRPPDDDVYNRIIEMINELGEDGFTEQKIIAALEAYLAENPIETGATAEQVEQINANTAALDGKVDIDQGWVNEDCILQVGADGKLKLVYPDSTQAYYIPQIDNNGNLKWVGSRNDMPVITELYPLYGKDGDDGNDGVGIESITLEEV